MLEVPLPSVVCSGNELKSPELKKLLYSRSDIKSIGVWLSNTQLLRLEAAGKFPRRMRLSAGSVCWDADEIHAWVERKKEERKRYHYAVSD